MTVERRIVPRARTRPRTSTGEAASSAARTGMRHRPGAPASECVGSGEARTERAPPARARPPAPSTPHARPHVHGPTHVWGVPPPRSCASRGVSGRRSVSRAPTLVQGRAPVRAEMVSQEPPVPAAVAAPVTAAPAPEGRGPPPAEAPWRGRVPRVDGSGVAPAPPEALTEGTAPAAPAPGERDATRARAQGAPVLGGARLARRPRGRPAEGRRRGREEEAAGRGPGRGKDGDPGRLGEEAGGEGPTHRCDTGGSAGRPRARRRYAPSEPPRAPTNLQ